MSEPRDRLAEAISYLEAVTVGLQRHAKPDELWWRLEEIGRNVSELGREAKIHAELVIDSDPGDD